MLEIDNQATADGYTVACTLGPVSEALAISYVIANAAVRAQLAPLLGSGSLGEWGPELLLTPQTNTVQRVGGIRFRSAVAGTPARVVAQLFQPADPILGAGTVFSGTLSASGGVTPSSVINAAKIWSSTGQLIASGARTMFSSWNFAADSSGGTIWSIANPSRIVCPADGYYLFGGNIQFPGGGGAGPIVEVYKNAAGVPGGGALCDLATGVPNGRASFCSMVKMVKGDYLEVGIFQNSGAGIVVGQVAANTSGDGTGFTADHVFLAQVA